MKQALWRLIPAETDGWMIAQYVATVTVTTLLATAAGATVFKIAPKLYSLLAGGREFYQLNRRRSGKRVLVGDGVHSA